jgi:hypothetical protein
MNNKMMNKRLIVLLIVFLLLSFLVNPSFAHRTEARVLGDATQAAQVSFTEVTSGPGVILPNSPLFFLDKIYQQLKLALVRSPEEKAKVRAEIIGERLAEVKMMILRDNEKGLALALTNLTEESNNAAADLHNQAEDGENVEEAAKTLNETVKKEKEVLDSLSENSTGSVKFTFRSAGEKVRLHKMSVEGQLPEELLEKEKEDQLQLDIKDHSVEAKKLTQRVEKNVGELEKYSSEAAKRLEKKRMEEIRKAEAAKNKELKRRQEMLLQLEKKKREELKKQQEILRLKAEQAAKALSELEKEVEVADLQEEESLDANSSGSAENQ